MTIEFGPRGIAMGLAGVGIASATAFNGAQAQTLAADAAAASNGIETVNVTAQRSSLDTLTAKIKDTPQSINIVPLEVMQQQGVATLQDALRNVPGITLNAGEGGTHGDLVNLRGFSAGDDYFMDGLRDTGMYDRDAFDYESVEVYKGPASTLFGRGSTGGVINQVLKNPQLYPIANFQITAGTNDEGRATGDVNYVLGDTSALRVNFMGQINKVEGRPYVRNQRWGIAPAIAFGIGTDTTFSLKYLHQQEDNLPDYGVPFVFGKVAPVPRDTFYGLPADDKFAANVDVLTGRVEHKINEWLSVSDTARYGRYSFDSRQTAPIYGNANCYAGAAPYAGAPLCAGAASDKPVTTFNPLYPVVGTPLDQIFVLRDRPSSEGVIRTTMNNLNFTAEFNTGFLKHTLVFGGEYDRETASLTRFTNQDGQIIPAPLLDPDPYEAFPGHQTTVRQKPVTKTRTLSGYAIDTIDIGNQWSLIGGVRFDNFHAKFDQNIGTAQHFKHTDEVVSPRAALVYKPTEDASVYFSYGTSYNPSAENLSLAASNKDLDPEKDRTFEVGAKATVLNGLLGLNVAAFDTKMTNARITDPVVPSLQTLAGTLHVKGVEFGAQGHITDNWEIVAGYTYLNPSSTGLVAAGVKGPIPNTAHNQANIWTTYDFDNGFKVGAGLNYIGERNAGIDNASFPGTVVTAHAPGYTTLDAMLGWQVNDHLSFQLNGYNLTDKYYFATTYFTRPGENHAVPGPGRTVLLTASLGL